MPPFFRSIFLLAFLATFHGLSHGALFEQTQTASQILDRAVGLERDGRFEAALLSYEKLFDFELNAQWQEEVLFRTARLRYQLAEYRKASEFFELILREYPKGSHSAETLSLLGWCHNQLGNLQEATKHFQILHAKFPQSAQAPEATYWLALAAADENNSATAKKYADWLIERLSDSPRNESDVTQLFAKSLCLKCKLEADAGHWKEIHELVTQYKNLIEESPDRISLMFWQAEAEFRTQDYEQSRKHFEELETLKIGQSEPWTGVVTLRRAQIAARRQQWSEVLRILKNFESDNPDFELQYEVDYLRGRSLAGRGEMSSARQAYRMVIDNPAAADSETQIRSEWMIGETFFHQKSYELARIAYEKVMQQKNPQWQARAALQAGKCWELQESWNEASEIYRSALKQWEKTDSAPLLEARLQWAEKQLVR